MKLNRSKNTKRNIIWGFINKIIMLGGPFIIRTAMIKTIGTDYLGLNSLFSSILQVLNLAELGFSSAIVYSMYKPIAEGKTDEICALLNYYRRIYKIIGSVIIIAGLIVTPFLPYLISGEWPSDINIYFVFLIYVFNTAIGYLLFAYKTSLLTAHQRFDLTSLVSTIANGLMYTVQILVLVVFRSYYAYILLMPIFTVINNIINAVIVDRSYPQYKCNGKISADKKKEIKYQVSGLMVNKVCQSSRNSFDSIFVSAFLGLTITAMYNNYYYILHAVSGIITILINSMLAGIGNSIVTESPSDNYKTMKKINFLYMWIGGWATVCLLCLYQPFMRVWVGNDLTFEYPVVILLSIYFYVLKMGDIRTLYSDAAGLWWQNRYRAIAEAITNIILNYVLVRAFGVYGIILATLISLAIINFGFGSQIIFKYYFKSKEMMMDFYTSHLRYLLVTVIVCLATVNLCSLLDISNQWFELIVRGVICVIIPNFLYWLFYFKTRTYREAIPWFLKVMGIKKR